MNARFLVQPQLTRNPSQGLMDSPVVSEFVFLSQEPFARLFPFALIAPEIGESHDHLTIARRQLERPAQVAFCASHVTTTCMILRRAYQRLRAYHILRYGWLIGGIDG